MLEDRFRRRRKISINVPTHTESEGDDEREASGVCSEAEKSASLNELLRMHWRWQICSARHEGQEQGAIVVADGDGNGYRQITCTDLI